MDNELAHPETVSANPRARQFTDLASLPIAATVAAVPSRLVEERCPLGASSVFSRFSLVWYPPY